MTIAPCDLIQLRIASLGPGVSGAPVPIHDGMELLGAQRLSR